MIDVEPTERQRLMAPHDAPVGFDGIDPIVVSGSFWPRPFLGAGLHYFPLAPGAIGNRAGLLCVNHESVSPDWRIPGEPNLPGGERSGLDEAREQAAADGVTVVQVCRPRRGHEWQVAESRYNRQITGDTPMEFSGPVRGSKWVRTTYSPAGTRVRGTRFNGADGVTPWGTYLACEQGSLHEPHGFGWVVEIDPFAPRDAPRKRTALGRLEHDRAWFAPATAGQPLVVHLGDGAPQGCLYKFVTRDVYRPGQTDGTCLDDGTLYVARCDAGGHAEWLALEPAHPGFHAAAAARQVAFEDQADVLVNARLAADVVGASFTGRSIPGP